MPFTREDAYRTLVALNPAPVFLQAYDTGHLPENLDLYFWPPEEFFLAPDSQHRYTEDRWVPILDDGNFAVVTFCDPESLTLRQMYVESPAEVLATFSNWEAFLDDLMGRMMETVEDDDQLRRMAELIGHRRPIQ